MDVGSVGFDAADIIQGVDNRIGILGFILGVIVIVWNDALGLWVYPVWFIGFVCSISGLFNYPRYIAGTGLFMALIRLNSWLPLTVILKELLLIIYTAAIGN